RAHPGGDDRRQRGEGTSADVGEHQPVLPRDLPHGPRAGLDRHARRPGVAVLDVGCGSGVLSVAAAVLGAGPVVAVDVDPVAVEATRRAAGVAGVAVDASTRPVAEVLGEYGLVLANIGAGALTTLAPVVVARVGPGGTLVLAGLLAAQAAAVAATYEREGLSLVEITERDGWASPEFLRKSTISRA
ncbi:MAG TPA: 50S ribosomal protein L11 methyltransferase, partial [Acidimicrobiales bacterium]|nr:50S ribosomal protein L11 methyltransferase [Acidimicrobiales bacterium]